MVKQKKTVFNEKDAIKILSSKYGFKEDELQSILIQNLKTPITTSSSIANKLPVSIIKNDKLSPLEAIVTFLRENRDLTYKEIGRLLSREPKTLAVTYSAARKKTSEKIIPTTDTIYLEFSIFAAHPECNLSILETVCNSLKKSGMRHSQIARILGKSQKTIWTVCNRAEQKHKKEEHE